MKKTATKAPLAKFIPVIAAAFASALSLAAAQTTPAPTSTPAPSAPAHTAGQIGPGTTGTISPAQGVTPTTAKKADQILKGALTPKTRQTLQEAMNSVTPPPADASAPANAPAAPASATAPAVTNAPPAAAGH